MTQGLKYVSLLNVSLKIKAILSVMFISFGGISIHVQTFSIINESNIKYSPFLIARILHSIIAGILMFISFDYLAFLITTMPVPPLPAVTLVPLDVPPPPEPVLAVPLPALEAPPFPPPPAPPFVLPLAIPPPPPPA